MCVTEPSVVGLVGIKFSFPVDFSFLSAFLHLGTRLKSGIPAFALASVTSFLFWFSLSLHPVHSVYIQTLAQYSSTTSYNHEKEV